MNEELISSAVSFLQDTTVAASPINKRIEFLQLKGLNEEEIDEAIKRANNPPADPSDQTKTTTATTYRGAILENQQTAQNFAPLDYYSAAPPLPERTWKDYFIMATATAGVTYGFYQVVSRYLLPSIIPPGRTRLDDDKQVIEEEFIKIDKVLEQMAIEQKEVKDANDAKLKDIDTVIENVNGFLQKYNTDKVKFDDDLKLMKLEVDNLQNSVEKNMRLTKESIHDELREIIEELDSLKSLIKVRGGATGVPERKVPPVSSIPSASEILKKAKSNGNSTSVPAKSPVDSSPVSEPLHSFSVTNSAESQPEKHRAPSFSAQKELHAAGIPDWQLAHKKKEEEESMEKSGDKKVQESILKVGVPQWQLNAS
ncbi:peroxin-14 [Metschnikowia aff. pulcherrima]|uniref:Peroxisomal membrane protein PEX14 n=1 Tax=Metschnikowia aff. pulcherrima TaxID=2163413 RepID=A0A4P6XN55_9ASCO|nr:peroxin-14 [Metschnikowia aff. pulcherrima]